MAFCLENVSERAAHPKHMEILPELPKTAVGKVFKPDLRKSAITRIYNAALADAGVDASVVSVMDDKKRGLVAQVSGGADDAAIGGVLGPSSISGNAHNPRHALRSRADVSARDLYRCQKRLLLFRVRTAEHIIKQFNKLRGVIVCQGIVNGFPVTAGVNHAIFAQAGQHLAYSSLATVQDVFQLLTDFSPDPKWHRIIKRPSCAIVFRKFAASAAFVSISLEGILNRLPCYACYKFWAHHDIFAF